MAGGEPRDLGEAQAWVEALVGGLLSPDQRRAARAVERFRASARLPSIPREDLADREAMRAHAREVIAESAGQPSWSALVARMEKRARIRANDASTPLYPPWADAYMPAWCASHDEARRVREEQSGYLLPYRHHFFVASREYVAALGLDPDDPDWEAIGWDWARPADEAARARLETRLEARLPGVRVDPERSA
ncbi:MAG: hypothetical protein AAGB93_16225 [Planctomycetota bacterium]